MKQLSLFPEPKYVVAITWVNPNTGKTRVVNYERELCYEYQAMRLFATASRRSNDVKEVNLYLDNYWVGHV